MKPLFLELSLFGPYSKNIKLDFSRLSQDGLFVITGVTGSGKSSLFEAMFFALYGESSQKERGAKGYRSDFSKESSEICFIRFRFLVHHDIYEIKRIPAQLIPKKRGSGYREQKHEVELTCLTKAFSPLTRIDEVKSKIEALIGLNQEQFKKIIMLPQGDFQNFLLAETQEKKEILRNIFGTERYLAIQEKIKKEISGLKKTYDKLLAEKEILLKTYLDLTLDEESTLVSISEELKNRFQMTMLVLEKKNESFNTLKNDWQQAKLWQDYDKKLRHLMLEQKKHLAQENEILSYENNLALLEEIEKWQPLEATLLQTKNDVKTLTLKREALLQEQTLVAQEKEKLETLACLVDEKKEKYQSCQARILQYQREEKEARAFQEKKKEWLEAKKACEDKKQDYQVIENKLTLTEKKLTLSNANLQEIEQIREDYHVLEHEKLALEKDYEITKRLLQMIKERQQNLDELEKLDKQLSLQNQAYSLQEKEYMDFKDKVFELYRYELAQTLSQNIPCPVCGSVIHPHPFQKMQKISLKNYEEIEKKLKDEKTTLVKLQTEYEERKKQSQLVSKKLEYSLFEANIKEEDVEEKYYSLKDNIILRNKNLKALQDRLLTAEEVKKQKITLEENFKDLDETRASILKEVLNLETTALALKKHLEAHPVLASLEKIVQALKETENEKQAIEVWLDEFETDKENLGLKEMRILSALRTTETLWHSAKEKVVSQGNALEKLYLEHFDTSEVYHEFKKLLSKKDAIRKNIQAWYDKKQAFIVEMKTLKKNMEDLKKGNLSDIEKELLLLESEVQRLQKEVNTIEIKLKQIYELKNMLTVLNKKLDKSSSAYSSYYQVMQIATGENKWRMDFETFALVYYFSTILYYANKRLIKMTSGRYYFLRQLETLDKRKQSGLGLDIMDEYTGKSRQVSTLSGGESFKASLALALGLADVVREESGGITLDTIFIDEGFGTLDEESLDLTLDTLVELEEGGRLVGIISHVSELKERISQKLVVKVEKDGSVAYFEGIDSE